VSRPAEDIIKEVKALVEKGYKEIILLGQNVNSYNYEFRSLNFKINSNDLILKHSDIKNSKLNQNSKFKIQNSSPVTFPQLLKIANDVPGHFWLWFVSNHPKDFSDELIEIMTKCEKVCECVHLPIQAGDDKILQNMNRKYTAKEYLNLVEKIKKAFAKNKPGAIYSITSDIIVGFPGETKKQFLGSASVMKKVGYDMVFFGQFSRRPNTAAWNMKDNVKKTEKVRRERYLNEILKKTAFANNKKYIDKTLEILVTHKKDNFYFGHTRTYKNVKLISKKKNLVGKIVKAKITRANTWNLEGSL
jgi:tRNA-2-methylthio-N6-dimethylallyladenosine synthase